MRKEVVLKFKGLSITKEDFQEKYAVSLSDVEWRAIVTKSKKSWEDQIDELRLMAFRHIRKAMNQVGYKPILLDKNIKFTKED